MAGGIGNSIMNMFRGAPNSQQPGAAPNTDPSKVAPPGVGSDPAAAPPNPNTNKTIPSDGTQRPDGTGPSAFPAVAKDGEKSPLENYNDLWQIDPAKTPKTPSFTPNFNLDQKKLQEAAAGIDFSKAVSPEVITKAMGGDAAAMAQALNTVAQAGLVQSSTVAAKMVESALAQQAKAFEAALPNILKGHSVRDGLRSENEHLNNPAMAPLVGAVEQQMMLKYPQATPTELREQVLEYLNAMSTEMLTKSGKVISDPAPASKTKKPDTDWSAWALGTSS
jgi:hypothetical protein